MRRVKAKAMTAGAMAALTLAALLPISSFLYPQAAYAGPGGPIGGYDDNGNTVRGAIGFGRNLEGTLSTDRSQYPTSRAVELRLTIANRGLIPQLIPLSGRYPYDIVIRDSRSNRVVWSWSRHQSRPTASTLSIGGGKDISYREMWDQADDNGNRLPSGVYIVEARFLSQTTLKAQIYLSGREGGGNSGNNGGNGNGNGGPRPPMPPGQENGSYEIISRLAASSSRVQAGDIVNLTYTITNSSDRPRTYRFSSGKMFDMEAVSAVRSSNRPDSTVWRWSQGRMFTQMLQQFTLAPGQRRTFTAQWHVSNGLGDGAYDITAYLTPLPNSDGGSANANTRIYIGNPNGRIDDRAPVPGNLDRRGTNN